MPDSLCVLTCDHLRAEAQAVVRASDLPRLRSACFPARCGRPCVTWEELESARGAPGEPLVVFGGACLARLGDAQAEARGIALRRAGACAALVLNPKLVETLQGQGAYLLTPGWLENWRANLSGAGEDRGLLRDLWRESAINRLVLVDTGVGRPLDELGEISAHMGIPFEVLPAGLEHLQLLVERDALEARIRLRSVLAKGSLDQARRQAADRAVALDFLGTLSQSLQEADVVEGIRGLFRMLFHAEDVALLPPGEGCAGSHAETPGGFAVALGTSMGPVGVLRVEGLGFPQFKSHYLNLALSMAGVCALAVQNARAFRAAEESRAYQRLMLDILDVFYAPQGSPEDLEKALAILRDFAGADAIALRLQGDGTQGWSRALGYPAGLDEGRCRACLEAPAPGAARTARGGLRVDALGADCPCARAGFRSAALVRLALDKGCQGTLQLHSRAPGFFTALAMERLEDAARTLGIGLERRWGEADLRRANQELESRVEARTAELASSIRKLRREIQDRTRAENHLEAQSAVLKTHLRELHCLYALSSLFETHEGALEDLLLQALGLAIGGWSHPERTWARLDLGPRTLRTTPYRETPWRLEEPIAVGGEARGLLVVYVDAPGGRDPFHPEERGLIRTLADMIQNLLERAEVEDAREKAEQQLRQSQKLEAIGTLAGGIAHDFNNALTPILSLSDLGLQDLPEGAPMRQNLEIIRKAASRAKDLVDQILLFSRRKPPRLLSLDLAPLLEDILRLMRATLPSTIEIRTDFCQGCGPVLGDPSQLHQVVMNLCTNAWHAMRETGGLLTVRLEPALLEAGDPLCGPGLEPGRYTRLDVSDTGPGMSRDVQARIFEPFFTTKEAGAGTGLGLAVVHGIITSYRGHISVTSEPGAGTTFRILLPLSPRAAENPPEAAGGQDLPRGTERLLLVDDEEPIRLALGRILGNLGYRTECAASGPEALARFREDPAFDLVVTDMTMPRMTGLDLARRIRELDPGARFLLCSGFSDRLDPGQLQALGIREFVAKPFAVATLAQAVRRELDRRDP